MSAKDRFWKLNWVCVVSGFIAGAVIASAAAFMMASQTPLGIEDLPSIVLTIISFGMFSGWFAQVCCWLLRWLRSYHSRNIDSNEGTKKS